MEKESVGPFKSPLPKGFKFIEMNPPAEKVVWKIKTRNSEFLAYGTLHECRRLTNIIENAMCLVATYTFKRCYPGDDKDYLDLEKALEKIENSFETFFRYYIQL